MRKDNNSKFHGGKVSSSTPGYPGSKPLSSKQSSGRTQHARMSTAKKVENLNGMPTVHD